MRNIEFVKLHGAGNDFIFIEDLKDKLDLQPEQVAALCHRHTGIGADGVVVVKPPANPEHDGFMHYINADGTLAQMCGNGVRCFAKYLVDYSVVPQGKSPLYVETRAGIKAITYTTDSQGNVTSATVDMGKPILKPTQIPTLLPANAADAEGTPYVSNADLESPYGTFAFTCISMGNPHAVAFVEDVETLDVAHVGAFFESHEVFPEKCNIEFAQITKNGIRMRVFERGCGETLACGTGACATAVAAYLTGRAGTQSTLLLTGGTLKIDYQPGKGVFMTGPAAESFQGSFPLAY